MKFCEKIIVTCAKDTVKIFCALIFKLDSNVWGNNSVNSILSSGHKHLSNEQSTDVVFY